MSSKRQQSLINLAKSGKISGMYQLISDGTYPFCFDEHSKNALDYAIETDPIKAHILLNDLDRICTSPISFHNNFLQKGK